LRIPSCFSGYVFHVIPFDNNSAYLCGLSCHMQALSQFGTDFTLIAQLFPGRQRKHLKKKFCKEGKVNAARVDAAMRASAHATINSYKEMIVLLKKSGMKVQRTYNTSS
jgi:hypothetical protein